MKNALGYSIGFSLIALGLLVFLQNAPKTTQAAKAVEAPIERSDVSVPVAEPARSTSTPYTGGRAGRVEEPVSLHPLNSGDDIAAAVAAVDLWSQVDLAMLSNRLREADDETVSRFFVDAIEATAEKPAERDRLISVASEFGGENLLGFWQKVIATKAEVPPTHNHPGDFDEPDSLATQELYKSLRSVRLIATRDIPARDYLESLVLDKTLHQGDNNLRKQAFFALKEVDPSRTARVLRSLDDKDSLASEIIAQ